MGCDGGSIPKRIEMIRLKKRAERIERDMENVVKWKICALTQEPLRQPIVACPLGKLYNKEAVIEALISKTIGDKEAANHIKSLRDLKELKLTPNAAFDESKVNKGDAYSDYNVAQFVCPVVGLEMSGYHRFCVVWTCGCVVSEKALKQVKGQVCHKCGGPLAESDLVVINGTADEQSEYARRLTERRDAAKTAKKDRKAAAADSSADTEQPSTSKASGTKRKAEVATSGAARDEQSNIQGDPSASKVFKSLFTTSQAAKDQPRAHWITYNPQYY